MNLYTLEEMLDRHIGAKGTPERDKHDADIRAEVEAYYIGEAIKATRLSQHLTQKQLGERLGVKEARISKIENGQNINLTTFIKIFKAMGVNAATLDLGAMGKVALW